MIGFCLEGEVELRLFNSCFYSNYGHIYHRDLSFTFMREFLRGKHQDVANMSLGRKHCQSGLRSPMTAPEISKILKFLIFFFLNDEINSAVKHQNGVTLQLSSGLPSAKLLT